MPFLHKGYRFNKGKDLAGGAVSSWRCQRRQQQQCMARIHVNNEHNAVVAEFGEHNHDAPGEEAAASLPSSASASQQNAVSVDEEDVEDVSLADLLRVTEAENTRLRADLASKKKLLVDQKLELEAMRQRDVDADREKASLQQKVNDLTAQLLKSFGTSKSVADAKKRLREENAQLKNAQDAWKTTETRLKEKAEAAVGRASHFESELKDLHSACEEEKSKERFALESIKKEHEQKQFELRKHLENAEQKVSKLTIGLAEQKQRAVDDEADLRFMVCQQTQDLFVSQKQLKALRKQVESLKESRPNTLEDDLESFKVTADATESKPRNDLAIRDQALGHTKRRLEDARKEVDELTEGVAKLNDEKNRLDKSVETLEGELKSLKATSVVYMRTCFTR